MNVYEIREFDYHKGVTYRHVAASLDAAKKYITEDFADKYADDPAGPLELRIVGAVGEIDDDEDFTKVYYIVTEVMVYE